MNTAKKIKLAFMGRTFLDAVTKVLEFIANHKQMY